MSGDPGPEDSLFRALLDASNDLIFVMEPSSGKIVDANATASEHLGYGDGGLLGTPIWETETPIGNAAAWEEHVDWVRRRGSSMGEGRMRRKDGATFPVETNVKHIRLEGREYMVAVARDISERKRAEAERDSQLALFRSLVDNMQDGILIEWPDRTVAAANEALCEIFDLPGPAALTGRDCAQAARSRAHLLDDPDGFIRRVEGIVASRELVRAERVAFADGRAFERDHVPIVTPDGELVGHMWQYRDVTEQSEIRRRELELIGELRAVDRMKDAFLAAASHEIRTPLTTVVGFTHALLEHGERLDPDARIEIVQALNRNARKLQQLLEGLLDLEEIRRGAEPQRQPVDVSAVVRERAAEAELGGRSIDVVAPPCVAVVDGTHVARMTDILLDNVRRHTPPGTPVWVRVEARGTGVLLAVEDGGPGVADEDKEAVFRPFQTAGRRAHAPGLGAGLALVAGLAEAHGGRAWVVDREGGGASFRVLLPSPEEQPAGTG